MIDIQMESIFFLFLSLHIIFIINRFRYEISSKTKLLDKPDSIRKFHLKSTPLLGGMMIFSSFVLINIYLILFQDLNKSNLIIFISCLSCFIVGLIDDAKGISYKYKFFILTIIFYLTINFDTNLQINKIYIITLDKIFYLDYLSIPFTILCLLLLINAINLIDGIDGLCILVSIVLLTYLIINFQTITKLYILLIISLTFILYLNLKKNIFLGDFGSLFLGSLIGINIINSYNLEISNNYYAIEEIFILLMLPGLDMIRVFLARIINKKNPFSPDRIHLHHLLIKSGLNILTILTIFILLILSPIFINIYTNFKPIFIILIFILVYAFLIIKLKKIK